MCSAQCARQSFLLMLLHTAWGQREQYVRELWPSSDILLCFAIKANGSFGSLQILRSEWPGLLNVLRNFGRRKPHGKRPLQGLSPFPAEDSLPITHIIPQNWLPVLTALRKESMSLNTFGRPWRFAFFLGLNSVWLLRRVLAVQPCLFVIQQSISVIQKTREYILHNTMRLVMWFSFGFLNRWTFFVCIFNRSLQPDSKSTV